MSGTIGSGGLRAPAERLCIERAWLAWLAWLRPLASLRRLRAELLGRSPPPPKELVEPRDAGRMRPPELACPTWPAKPCSSANFAPKLARTLGERTLSEVAVDGRCRLEWEEPATGRPVRAAELSQGAAELACNEEAGGAGRTRGRCSGTAPGKNRDEGDHE